jgi:organic hydroperoxide reductase OsmC/OhrA
MPLTKKGPYTAKARTSGGREGTSHTADGRFSVAPSNSDPKTTDTNPEQLFAFGGSGCFLQYRGGNSHFLGRSW